jgi:hypothetical protein
MKAFISILSGSLASLSLLSLVWIIGIYWFVSWKILLNISSVIRQFHASKGVLAFLPWPVTSGNFVRIFCQYAERMSNFSPYPTSSCPFQWQQLSVASISLQK